MIDDLSSLTGLAAPGVAAALLVFVRLGAMAAVLPFIGEYMVPVRVRLAVVLGLTMMIAPMLPGVIDHSPPVAAFGAEVVSGLFFGILLRLVVFALQTAGVIVAQAASLSQFLGPGASPDPMPAMGVLLLMAGLALAATLGVPFRLLSYILESYDAVPAGTFIAAAEIAEIGVAGVSRLFMLAFALAAPFVIASFLYNLTLGFINRAMPQLMVAFVGAPALTAGGLILLMLVSPLLLGVWIDAMDLTLRAPLEAR
jgi:flagellar biosynthetic protein FliR